MIRDAAQAGQREHAALAAAGKAAGTLPTANFLAVSGGGDAGAFGAGVLVGWTAHGTRPFLDRWGTPLLFGPGSVLVAHTDHEQVAIAELQASVDRYVALATTLLTRSA